MSFRIYVVHSHESLPKPNPEDDVTLWDKWLEEENKFTIYDEPLGADGSVYEYWCTIATLLGLPMITGIYNNGLRIQTNDDLQALERELDLLLHYWRTHKRELKVTKVMGISKSELMIHLRERMVYFRTAIRIARENDAVLLVV